MVDRVPPRLLPGLVGQTNILYFWNKGPKVPGGDFQASVEFAGGGLVSPYCKLFCVVGQQVAVFLVSFVHRHAKNVIKIIHPRR